MEVVINAEPVSEQKKERKYDKWEIEDAYRSLKRAEEIKANPELLKLVKKEYDKDAKAIKSLAGLKALAITKKADEDGEEEEE